MTIMKESHCPKHISHVLKQNPVRWWFNQCEPHHTFKPKEFPACTPLSPPSLIRIGSSAWILLRIGWSNDLLGFHECRASMNVVYIVLKSALVETSLVLQSTSSSSPAGPVFLFCSASLAADLAALPPLISQDLLSMNAAFSLCASSLLIPSAIFASYNELASSSSCFCSALLSFHFVGLLAMAT